MTPKPVGSRWLGLWTRLVALVLLMTTYWGFVRAQADSSSGYKLPSSSQYFAVAPQRVRPEQMYQVYVSVYRLPYDDIDVRAVLSRNGEEYASGLVTFNQIGTKHIEILVPATVLPGEHKLLIEGSLHRGTPGSGQPVFRNETALSFQPKYISLFIQTSRPVYYSGQKVNFRIVGVKPGSLKPATGDMTIYVRDGAGNIVRRWLSQQLNLGIFNSAFEITYPLQTGTWSILVDAFGHRYEQDFGVEFWFERRFEVNITTPLYVLDSEWGIGGSFQAEHRSGILASGNATVRLTVREKDGRVLDGQLEEKFSYMTGLVPFKFTMNDIRNSFGDVSNKELVFHASINDWDFLETQTSISVTQVIRDGVEIKLIGRKLRTFKPRTPFTVSFAVVRAGGGPFNSNVERQIYMHATHTRGGQKAHQGPRQLAIVPGDGVVHFRVVPEDGDLNIKITAWHPSQPSRIVEVETFKYFSWNNRYLSLTTSTKKPKVNEYMIFTLRTNFHTPEVNYIVAAGGSILLGNILTMNSHQKTFTIAVSREMAPRARLVVYCMVDGEFLVDSINFFVKDTRLTGASLFINYGKDFRQDTLELIGRGNPGSFIGINGFDYDLYARGGSTFLHKEKIVEELSTYDEPFEGPYQHIWWYDSDQWEESVFFTAPTGGMDLNTTFNLSGLVALSDTNLTVTPESHTCNATLGHGRCLNGQCFELEKLCDGVIDCLDGFDESACPMIDNLPMRRGHRLADLKKVSRHYADGDWCWKTSFVKPNGAIEMRLDVPETTDAVVIGAFILHPELGLSIVEQPAQHDTSRQFYMVADAPEALRRGEQVGIQLAIFNNWEQDIECILTLHGGDDYRFVFVPHSGIVSSYRPKLVSGDVQTMVELPAGTAKYVYMPIVAVLEKGEFTVTISAQSFLNYDIEEVEFSIDLDGAENDDHEPYLVDLVNQGSQLLPVFDIPIPERFVYPGQAELLYVPGSNVAHFRAHGDVVSAGFFEDFLTTDTIIGLPHDSADGYMFDFAINLQTLNYLQATNSLDGDKLQTVLEYMRSIMMRQYAYMQPNGAVKQFRRTEKPCVWLTSFVLRWLHAAKLSDWDEQLYVDPEVLNKMAMWLTEQQDENGAFIETADYYYDRNMWPNTTDNDGQVHQWHIPVTAEVTITLASCTRLAGTAKILVDTAKRLAADYLADKINDITDPLQMAMVAYALHQAKHRSRGDAYIRLQSMKREGEFAYWASEDWPSNPTLIINTVHYMQPRDDFVDLAHAVMATSYGLMLHLDHNELRASVPIMKWLLSQHMHFTVWSSTQDSLLALQALTEFALRETNRAFYQMEITIVSTAQPAWRHVIRINRTNIADLHEFELDHAWGEIQVYAQGTGYAFVGMTAAHKVEHAPQVAGPDYDAFDFQLERMHFHGRNGSIMDMTVCTRWLRPDLAPVSGMMVLVMEIPTGHVVARDAIEAVYEARIPGVQRVRFRDQTLIIFYEYVTQKKTCVDIRAERWYPVANVSISHLVTTNEYSETGLQYNTLYQTYTLFHLHICQVCGSFQCPYCLHYNSSPALSSPTLAMLLAFILQYLTLRRIFC